MAHKCWKLKYINLKGLHKQFQTHLQYPHWKVYFGKRINLFFASETQDHLFIKSIQYNTFYLELV